MNVNCPRCGAKIITGRKCLKCGATISGTGSRGTAGKVKKLFLLALSLLMATVICVYFEFSAIKHKEEVSGLESKAEGLIREGNTEQALQVLEEGVSKGNHSEKIYLMLGESYENLDNMDMALESYEKGRKKYPKTGEELVQAEVNIFLRQMDAAYEAKEYEQALELAEKVLELDQDDDRAGEMVSLCTDALNAMEETQESKVQADADGVILSESSSRYLEESDLQGLSKTELRLARNEIYARHGRKFTDEALMNYFMQFDWYGPSVDAEDFSEDMLNQYERYNGEFILSYEKEMGYIK